LAPPARGDRGGGAKHDSAELRELRRRNKLLEQENEILRATAYFARDVLLK
jgi:transposase